MLAYIPDQHWYIAAFFQSRTFQHLSGGGIWEFAKHVERVLHASLECQLHKSTFTSFRGPTDCRALWWSCASFFVATEKGKRRIPGLKTHTLCNFSQHQDLWGSLFFFSLLSFCACVGPTVLFLWQIFFIYFDPRILFNPENLLTLYNGFLNRGNEPNSPHFKV